MDEDPVKRAEELLEERMKRRTNGHALTDEESPPETSAVTPDESASRSDTERLQRLAADFANYRKRNEAERAEFAKYAKSELIRRLLDVLDGYDRALETLPAELKAQPWVEGMWLVERKLRGVLEGEGLQPIDVTGKRFDPYEHEAVARVPSDEPEGTIVNEYQKGYRLHDRVIRPALVTVSEGHGARDPSTAPDLGGGAELNPRSGQRPRSDKGGTK